MQPYTSFQSSVVLLPVDNIDTDQIIPARFLKVTDKLGLGKHLFADWRYLPAKDGGESDTPNPDFVLNHPHNQGAQVLLAGNNFGCGSSREHAPWALTGWGLRAVISACFADIFRNNALKNGLLPILLPTEAVAELTALLTQHPQTRVEVNLPDQTLTVLSDPQKTYSFPVDAFSKTCLVKGVDELGYLLDHQADIAAYEAQNTAFIN